MVTSSFQAKCKKDHELYILVYVDDRLVVSHDPNQVMTTFCLTYWLKEDPTPPKTYLGATVKE
jgi:hypothetical protein